VVLRRSWRPSESDRWKLESRERGGREDSTMGVLLVRKLDMLNDLAEQQYVGRCCL
jgi:hypothetical protein